MSDINGIDVLKKAKTLYPDIEGIVITGFSDEDITIKALRAGAFDYINKPINIEAMIISIEKAIERINLYRTRMYRNRELKITSEIMTKINKDLESDLPIINSDPLQINQVFTNLIINSYNAIKDKGEIKIKTYSKNDEIHVDIWDNGDIIPDYMIDKIFDPYQKDMDGIDRKELGLVISYNIVKRFNGDIKIDSSADKGTTFFVSLPYN